MAQERVDNAVANRTGRTPAQLAGNKLFDSEPPKRNYYASVFTQCLNLHMSDQPMAELMIDPAIGQMAAELLGVQGIRIWCVDRSVRCSIAYRSALL